MKPLTDEKSPKALKKLYPLDERGGGEVVSRNRIMAVLGQVNEISRAINLEDLFNRTLDVIIQASEAESAIFYLYDPGTDELVFTSVRGDDESLGLEGLRLKKHLWLVEPGSSKSKVIIVGDMASDPVLLKTINPAKAASLRNTIVIPLLLEEKTFGVIQVFNYTRCELDVLEALANHFVIEADRMMMLEMTEQSNRRLKLLVDMIGKVSGTLDRKQLLQIVPEQAARLTEADRSSLFLVDSSTNELGFHASYQTPPDSEAKDAANPRQQYLNKIIYSIKSERSVTSHAAEKGKVPPEGFGFATRSAITVPLQESKITPGTYQDQQNSAIGGLTVLKMHGEAFDEQDVQFLEALAHQASIFIQAAELYENINDLFLDVIKALVAAIDAKDRSTQGHSIRVFEYALAIANELQLDGNTISDIRIGSLLHDVGKIGISDQILSKPGILTREEYKIIKKHPLFGRQIMSQVRVLQSVLPGISEHHERLDGSGYPYGLTGDQISIAGRVIAVADVFDAMTTDRPYRKALSMDAIMGYLLEEGGRLFDRECVKALQRVVERDLHMQNPTRLDTNRNGDSSRPSPFPQDLILR